MSSPDPLEERVLSGFFSRTRPREHADIYVVRNLPQEIRATLNGLYSRSHLSMRHTFLKRLRDGLEKQGLTLADLPLPESGEQVLHRVMTEKAGVFLRTYAIDHGHNSLREGARVHLAVERVSQLVTRFMQRERRASFEESSTRYISFSREEHWRDPEVMAQGPPWSGLYEEIIDESFGFYREAIDLLQTHIQRARPKASDEDEKGYRRAVKAESFDSARYLLTPALFTKFGLVADARTLADMATELLSHPLTEFRIVGRRLLEEAKEETPTLLTHAAPNPYLQGTRERSAGIATELDEGPSLRSGPSEPSVRLLSAPSDIDERVLASLLYAASERSFDALLARVSSLAGSEKQRLLEELLGSRGPRDAVPIAVEGAGLFEFEILVDFGAYRDIGRHRKGFQEQQALTTRHGYAVPPLFDAAGLGERYRRVMESIAEKAEKLGERFPEARGYVVPFAFLQRVRLQFDARQMAYFIELRSAPEGHFSYRRIAIRMWEALRKVAPLYARWIRVCADPVFLGRVAGESQRVERRKQREDRASELGFEV